MAVHSLLGSSSSTQLLIDPKLGKVLAYVHNENFDSISFWPCNPRNIDFMTRTMVPWPMIKKSDLPIVTDVQWDGIVGKLRVNWFVIILCAVKLCLLLRQTWLTLQISIDVASPVVIRTLIIGRHTDYSW